MLPVHRIRVNAKTDFQKVFCTYSTLSSSWFVWPIRIADILSSSHDTNPKIIHWQRSKELLEQKHEIIEI